MTRTACVAVAIVLFTSSGPLPWPGFHDGAVAMTSSYEVRQERSGLASVPGTVPDATIEIPLRIEGNGVAGFNSFVISTLNDPRSWYSAGFRFREDPSSRFRVVLAEPAAADRLCLPLRTHGTLSCQNGDVVALNADRWRNGTSDWDGSIDDYRRYMVNHEVGHLIGQRHPTPRCPAPGTPSAVMEQQTKGLAGCRGNVWPLWWEIERAAQRPAVLAPLPDWQPEPVPRNLGGAVTPPSGPPSTTDPEPSHATADAGVDRNNHPNSMQTGSATDPASRSTGAGQKPGTSVPSSNAIGDPDVRGGGGTHDEDDDASDGAAKLTRETTAGTARTRSLPMQIAGLTLIVSGLIGAALLWIRRCVPQRDDPPVEH